MTKYCVIKTTFKKKGEAKKMAQILLENKLIACAQISTIESLYSWEGHIEEEKEFLLELKTKESLYQKIEKIISANHSYQTPQIIALSIQNISKPYAQWLDGVVKNK